MQFFYFTKRKKGNPRGEKQCGQNIRTASNANGGQIVYFKCSWKNYKKYTILYVFLFFALLMKNSFVAKQVNVKYNAKDS